MSLFMVYLHDIDTHLSLDPWRIFPVSGSGFLPMFTEYSVRVFKKLTLRSCAQKASFISKIFEQIEEKCVLQVSSL